MVKITLLPVTFRQQLRDLSLNHITKDKTIRPPERIEQRKKLWVCDVFVRMDEAVLCALLTGSIMLVV